MHCFTPSESLNLAAAEVLKWTVVFYTASGTLLLGTQILNQHFSIILFTILQQGKLCATIYNLILNKIIITELGNALMAIEHLWSLILSLNDTVLLLDSENSSNPSYYCFSLYIKQCSQYSSKSYRVKSNGIKLRRRMCPTLAFISFDPLEDMNF